jgi:hypothetical protein
VYVFIEQGNVDEENIRQEQDEDVRREEYDIAR